MTDTIRKEILASQAVAVISADWSRPTPQEILEILERASWQVKDSINFKFTEVTTPTQEQS